MRFLYGVAAIGTMAWPMIALIVGDSSRISDFDGIVWALVILGVVAPYLAILIMLIAFVFCLAKKNWKSALTTILLICPILTGFVIALFLGFVPNT